MRELRALQKNFQLFLLEKNPRILPQIMDVPPVPAKQRLEIYEDAYYLRLLESLQLDYEVIYALMGEEQFDHWGRLYIQHFPSTFRSVRWFGKTFGNFLRESRNFDDKPWIIEMAAFEWSLTETFDGPDCSVVTVEEMVTIPPDAWPTLQFSLQPTFKMLDFSWNTAGIWNAFKEKQKLPKPKRSKSPVTWMLWRKEYEVQFASLQMDEKAMLMAMSHGANFSEICEALCEWIEPEQVAFHAATKLKQFIVDQLIMALGFVSPCLDML